MKPDLRKFSQLQQYGGNFLLLAAVDAGYFDIVKFLLEIVKVDVN
jgi:ankyrin repeat protein